MWCKVALRWFSTSSEAQQTTNPVNLPRRSSTVTHSQYGGSGTIRILLLCGGCRPLDGASAWLVVATTNHMEVSTCWEGVHPKWPQINTATTRSATDKNGNKMMTKRPYSPSKWKVFLSYSVIHRIRNHI